MNESNPINDLEIQKLAMDLNAMEHRHKRALMAAQMLESLLHRAADIVDALDKDTFESAITLNLLLIAKESSDAGGGRTNLHKTSGYLIAAALRSVHGLVQGIKQTNDPSADPDAPIVI